MGLLNDKMIRHRSFADDMIVPFVEKQESEGVISYGLSSYGYDARLANKFKIFHNINSTIIDPKGKDQECFVEVEGDHCIIPPNSYVLGHTVEKFKIPRDILVVCLGKSTYARWGIIVNVTPLEPEWEGTVTLEISNATPCPVKVYANEGICQLLFLQACTKDNGIRNLLMCETSYADRKGKYQGQDGITLGMVNPETEKPTPLTGKCIAINKTEYLMMIPRLVVGASVSIREQFDINELYRVIANNKEKAFSSYYDDANHATVTQRTA